MEQTAEQVHDAEYTVEQAASILGVSKSTIRRAARLGQLGAVRGGLMGDRLKAVTAASVHAVIDYRREHHMGEIADNDGYLTRDCRPKNPRP